MGATTHTALVTGGMGGLGEAIARHLHDAGHTVLVTHARSDEAANLWLRKEADAGYTFQCYDVDVADWASTQAMAERIAADGHAVDILVNNAGIGYLMKALVDVEAQEWDAVLGVNLRGAFLATKHAARAMIAAGGGGRIVNIASQAAKSAFPHASAYCSSKHGLVGLTRVAALELGAHGINVNAVCPNHVTTGLGAWQNEYFAAKTGRTVEQYLADMRARIPLGRPGLPTDTAAAVAYLCSDDAVYVTGEAINVSGGEENH